MKIGMKYPAGRGMVVARISIQNCKIKEGRAQPIVPHNTHEHSTAEGIELIVVGWQFLKVIRSCSHLTQMGL